MISAAIIKWLVANIDEEKQITQVKVLGRSCPLIAVYNKDVASIFEEHLMREHLKLRMVVDAIPTQIIEVPEEWCALLQNINTKEDYQNILK